MTVEEAEISFVADLEKKELILTYPKRHDL
jgi:hypothetical protein